MSQFLRGVIVSAAILTVTVLIILWGGGYRIGFRQGEVTTTGSLVATSHPAGAQVFVDGVFRTATNSTTQLPPGEYKIRIGKEGFIPWEKQVIIQAKIATQADATLFPINPSLSPLTSTGIANPTVSPDGSRIVFYRALEASPSAQIPGKPPVEGLWVLELVERPLSLNRDPKQIARNLPGRDWSQAKTVWSPDSAQILAVFFNQTESEDAQINQVIPIDRAFLLDAGQYNASAPEVTATVERLLTDWEQLRAAKERDRMLGFPKDVAALSQTAIRAVAFSPDETKLLYEATAAASIPTVINPPLPGTDPTPETRNIEPGKLYVYDVKEDRNYFIMEEPADTSKCRQGLCPAERDPALRENIPVALPLIWYPDSRHLVLLEGDKISIMEYDGSNKTTVYAGPFVDGFVAPWPTGGKLIILTTLNPAASGRPNLYLLNLR